MLLYKLNAKAPICLVNSSIGLGCKCPIAPSLASLLTTFEVSDIFCTPGAVLKMAEFSLYYNVFYQNSKTVKGHKNNLGGWSCLEYAKKTFSSCPILHCFQTFVMSTENAIYSPPSFLLGQFPRLVPRAAPNFLQTLVVKKVRSNIAKQCQAQGIGRHSRWHLVDCFYFDLQLKFVFYKS